MHEKITIAKPIPLLTVNLRQSTSEISREINLSKQSSLNIQNLVVVTEEAANETVAKNAIKISVYYIF